jgi:adenylate cyclase
LLARVETALAGDRSNGWALAYGVNALAALGEMERAKDWLRRAVLIDPDNAIIHYNLACALSVHFRDFDGALDMLRPFSAAPTVGSLRNAKVDPELDPIRDNSRFVAMLAAAEARVAADQAAATAAQ